jgi:hypothetical protein
MFIPVLQNSKVHSVICQCSEVAKHLRRHGDQTCTGNATDGRSLHRTLDSSLDGPMMSVYSRAAAAWEHPSHRHGGLLSTIGALPPTVAAQLPFCSGAQLQADVLSMRHLCGWLAFIRDDGDGGRVTLGPQVQPCCIAFSSNSNWLNLCCSAVARFCQR